MNEACPWVEPPIREGKFWKAVARFGGEEPFFADHFPGYPVVPGVLLFEILRTTAKRVLFENGREAHLLECSRVRFIRPVTPPAELKAVLSPSEKDPLRFKGEIQDSKGEKIATATLVFAAEEKPK